MAFSKYGFIAAQRYGLGPKRDDMRKIEENPKQWLKNQVAMGQRSPLRLKPISTDQLVRDIVRVKKSRETRPALRKKAREIYSNEMEARFNLALETDQPFIERLVHFWSNHFTVSYASKPFVSAIVGAFEREAIRPHVLGKFSDMLIASTQHPAMLIYLDNATSIGPNSKAGKRRDRGLNENLGREILELHTLGVNGGYSQKDVLALSKIITGWSIAPIKKNGGNFRFLPQAHEPGSHILLGKQYPEAGVSQGVLALMNLARHPSTAKFIATKLVRHFVDDNPPNSAVKKIEQVFQQTKGDLKAVSLALIDLKEAWQEPLPKIKTPYEMIVSSMRFIGKENTKIPLRKITQSLKILDHLPFNANSPAGWSDKVSDWVSPNGMINRVEWSQAFAQATALDKNPLLLAREAIGGVANSDTLLWIERAPSAKEGLALLLASPEWQRR